MLQKIMSVLKSGSFWAGFVVGAIAATAFPKLRNVAAPVASKLPGASS
jgi:hypothetical protein